MPEPAEFLTGLTYLFILVLFRFLGLFILTPILSSDAYPRRVKVAMAFLLAVAVTPMISAQYDLEIPGHILYILGDIIRELGIGLFIGFMVQLVFAAFQLAGQFIDLKMGFMIANVFDPVSGVTVPLTGQFKNALASLLFLSINGHLILVDALHSTFDTVPPGQLVVGERAWGILFRHAGDMFITAFMIALPILGTVFMADVIFGFLARSIPQMNIFIVGLPAKIFIGFLMFFLASNLIFGYYLDIFGELFEYIEEMLNFFS